LVCIKRECYYIITIISNYIFIYGFPTGFGIPTEIQFDKYKPVLRKGIVAGKNLDTKTFLLDCPAYPGNSGGPIIAVGKDDNGFESRRIIGIVTQYIPYLEPQLNQSMQFKEFDLSNSGLSVGIPIESIDEIIEELKKRNYIYK